MGEVKQGGRIAGGVVLFVLLGGIVAGAFLAGRTSQTMKANQRSLTALNGTLSRVTEEMSIARRGEQHWIETVPYTNGHGYLVRYWSYGYVFDAVLATEEGKNRLESILRGDE